MKPTKAQVEKVAKAIYYRLNTGIFSFSTLGMVWKDRYIDCAKWLIACGLDPEKVKT